MGQSVRDVEALRATALKSQHVFVRQAYRTVLIHRADGLLVLAFRPRLTQCVQDVFKRCC